MLSNEPFSIAHFKAFIYLSAVFLSLSVRISFNSPGKEEKKYLFSPGQLKDMLGIKAGKIKEKRRRNGNTPARCRNHLLAGELPEEIKKRQALLFIKQETAPDL